MDVKVLQVQEWLIKYYPLFITIKFVGLRFIRIFFCIVLDICVYFGCINRAIDRWGVKEKAA